MPDAPTRSLVETVAAKYAEFLECAAARDLKAPLCMDDGMCSCRRDVAFIASAVLDAIAEPSDAMLAAAVVLPVTEQVNNMIGITAMRYGGGTVLPLPPNSPIQQWYRIMIAELRKEIENG